MDKLNYGKSKRLFTIRSKDGLMSSALHLVVTDLPKRTVTYLKVKG